MNIRSVSFDTSFLLRDNILVDKVIKKLAHDFIPCFITSTVISELEQLKIWGRITEKDYKKTMKRLKHTHAKIIDFKNRLLSDAFGKACMISMEKHHGVKPEDIVNDCSILVSTLKNGVNVFLSEDFHFTSRITEEVIKDVTNNACVEYHQMCGKEMYAVDNKTFLEAYRKGNIDLEVIDSHRRDVIKPGK